MSQTPANEIKPGDLFEDADLHPAVCLKSSPEFLFAVSLVDGTCREREKASGLTFLKLSISDAISWRFSGPMSRKHLVSDAWWKAHGVDPVALYGKTSAGDVATQGQNKFSAGDLYEGPFLHPCICLWIIDGGMQIGGISLVNGNYPKIEDLGYSYARKLTPEEAWIWRTKGPQDNWWSDVSLSEALSVFTEEDTGPNHRWWK